MDYEVEGVKPGCRPKVAWKEMVDKIDKSALTAEYA